MSVNYSFKNSLRNHFKIRAGSYKLELGSKTSIMAILNMTPDSFSHDGLLKSNIKLTKALNIAQQFVDEGADIIDVGGESTRPGSKPITIKEEIKRVIPVIAKLTKKIKIPISVDTYKTDVAKGALDAGAMIVNTIKGINPDNNLLRMVKNYNAAIVLMHMKGTPETMQKNIHYKSLIKDIIDSLRKSVENCLEIGIKSDRIIIDPGIGFGKTLEQNLEIIHRLKEFRVLNKPILIGTSRKSFIGKILNNDVNERLYGTIATATASILNGAHILRVHDVKALKEASIVTDAILTVSKK